MRLKKVIDADDAVAVVRDGDVVASTGYGGNGTPEEHLERDVLAHLPFVPPIDGPRPMDPALFAPSPLKLRERLLDVRIDDRLTYDDTTNTVFMNYAGMRVRSEADIQRIVASVDKLLAPLGHRVNAIVNYDGFRVDDDVMPAYMDAVKYVAERYYVNVTRYAHSGLMRHLLGSELSRRALDAHVYETEDEAQRRLGAAD
jgi:propionate CoA-transferase